MSSGTSHWEELLYRKFCPSCSYHYNLSLISALENSMNYKIDPQVKIARVFLAEVERVLNHLHFAANFCLNSGLNMYRTIFAAKKDLYGIIHSISGETFLPGNTLGGTAVDLRGITNISKILDKVESIREKTIFWLSKLPNERISWLNRIEVVDEETCRELSTTGPLAKACGISLDARINDPLSCYSIFDFHPVTYDGNVATAYDCLTIRLEEIIDSLDLMSSALGAVDKRAEYNLLLDFKVFHGNISVKVESPKGRTICFLQSTSGSDSLFYSLITPSKINRSSLIKSLESNPPDKAAAAFFCFDT
ncbi:MAG: hypothetical protein ACTSRU_14575, partial [Candidatus Hodarchaeales archaeon]